MGTQRAPDAPTWTARFDTRLLGVELEAFGSRFFEPAVDSVVEEEAPSLPTQPGTSPTTVVMSEADAAWYIGMSAA